MHGLGNDFIIIGKDQIETIGDLQNLIILASNRQTGIGCDQFIIYDFQFPDFCEMI